MKRILCLGFVSMFLVFQFIYGQGDSSFYDHKISSFTKLKNGGIVMVCVGSGLGLLGTVMLMDLPSGYWSDNYSSNGTFEDDLGDVVQAIGGIVCTALGIAMLAGGATMASIGGRKAQFYQEKKNKLTLGIILTPARQGLTLSYRF